MEGDAPALEWVAVRHLQPALVDQIPNELGMVHHFIRSTELRVFVFQDIETMRTSCDNSLDAVAIQGGDVLGRLHLP